MTIGSGAGAASAKIKVLIVDDSAIVRKILSEAIALEKDMEVVGTAPDPYVAREKILSLKPDVLTLDIEMPRMDGLTFLKKLMQYRPMPVIVISSLAQSSCEISLEALRYGAVEVMAKPGGPYSIGELREVLAHKLRAAAASRVGSPRAPGEAAIRKPDQAALGASRSAGPSASGLTFRSSALIAIGASTGGTEAIHDVLVGMPANVPPIVMAQHIPKLFSASFAERLNRVCAFEVKEAADGDECIPGRALLAPGDFHMVVRRVGSGYRVQIQDGPKVCYQRPSVDVLFSSVASSAGSNAIGVLLTGMGADGAQGLLSMRQAGARTIVQNEASCVVYGMPREAVRLGAAEQILGLDAISSAILKEASRR